MHHFIQIANKRYPHITDEASFYNHFPSEEHFLKEFGGMIKKMGGMTQYQKGGIKLQSDEAPVQGTTYSAAGTPLPPRGTWTMSQAQLAALPGTGDQPSADWAARDAQRARTTSPAPMYNPPARSMQTIAPMTGARPQVTMSTRQPIPSYKAPEVVSYTQGKDFFGRPTNMPNFPATWSQQDIRSYYRNIAPKYTTQTYEDWTAMNPGYQYGKGKTPTSTGYMSTQLPMQKYGGADTGTYDAGTGSYFAAGGPTRPNNPGFNALPPAVQQKIMNNMEVGGAVIPGKLIYNTGGPAMNDYYQMKNGGHKEPLVLSKYVKSYPSKMSPSYSGVGTIWKSTSPNRSDSSQYSSEFYDYLKKLQGKLDYETIFSDPEYTSEITGYNLIKSAADGDTVIADLMSRNLNAQEDARAQWEAEKNAPWAQEARRKYMPFAYPVPTKNKKKMGGLHGFGGQEGAQLADYYQMGMGGGMQGFGGQEGAQLADYYQMAKGGKWIQGAVKHPGRCTPGSPNYDCPKGSPQWRLAQTFKKHHGFHKKAMGGCVECGKK